MGSHRRLAELTRGSVAGLGATLPMTLVMELLRHRAVGPSVPLAPRRVTQRVLERLRLASYLDSKQKNWLSGFTHLGYGAGTGALYAALPKPAHRHPWASGIGFGLLVWAASYAGWLPAFNLLSTPPKQSSRWNRTLVLSHLVWGLVLAGLFRKVDLRSEATAEVED